MAEFTQLKTNYKDDILAQSNTKRKYEQISNSDGSVSFDDVTDYSQEGDSFSASDINETNGAINKIYSDRILTLDELELVTETGFFVDALAVKEAFSELSEESSANVFTNRFQTGIVMRKGNIKRLRLTNSTVNFRTGTAYELGTLPEEYTPMEQVVKFAVIAGNQNTTILGRLIIAANGEVTFTPYADRLVGEVINIDETYI